MAPAGLIATPMSRSLRAVRQVGWVWAGDPSRDRILGAATSAWSHVRMEITPLAPRGLFGRCHRLRTRADFTRVFRGGRRLRSRHFAIVVRAPARDGDGARLGLAVSRKSGNAPARARLRRLVREAFRSLRHDLTRPIEVVVRTLGPWPEADTLAVHAELGGLLQQYEARSHRSRKHHPKTRSESAHGTTSDPAPPPAGPDA